MSTRSIVSIGYEGRTPTELVTLLRAARVDKVLDVRELPLSRRKGFSKTPLCAVLARAGIEYRHLRAAGNPHRHPKADTAHCLALYARHLASHPEVLDVVAAELTGCVALLCFEREHEACHRSRLLDALLRRQRRRVRVVRIE